MLSEHVVTKLAGAPVGASLQQDEDALVTFDALLNRPGRRKKKGELWRAWSALKSARDVRWRRVALAVLPTCLRQRGVRVHEDLAPAEMRDVAV